MSQQPDHPRSLYHRVYWFDAQHRLFIAFAAAALVYLLPGHFASMGTRLIATWDTFAVITLTLCWMAMWQTHQSDIRRKAQQQDFGRRLIFIFTVLGACAAVGAVIFLMHSAKQEKDHLALHVAVSVIAIVASWLLLHTVFALRYAHSFYGDSREHGPEKHAGGLDFPGKNPPDYLDFAYFSFVIGMTFQVSDVQITSRRLRHLVLVQSMISFVFTVLIIALTINTVSNLLQ
ncbi:MAG: DUF1345 domain-containing protein [Chthoniobacteraceae bacterium]